MNVHSYVDIFMCASSCKDKHEAIQSATLKLLAEKGFHGFSIKQVATEAGVAAGTIYLYFKDKDALISDLHFMLVESVAQATFIDHDSSLPIRQQYQKICANIWQHCLSNEAMTLCKAQFDHLPVDILQTAYSNLWGNQFLPLAKLYEQGRQQGLFKPLPNDVLCSFSLEPIINLAGQQIIGLINITDNQLKSIFNASWEAISISSDNLTQEVTHDTH